ncbi:MAG: hypothetical protein L3J41_14625 [Melioribacteraceae bacterium]|nr:hypothetical protein [Melioribacteraceae bacterium]
MDILDKNSKLILSLLMEEESKTLTGDEIKKITNLSTKHINSAVTYLTGCGAIDSNFDNPYREYVDYGEYKFGMIREGDYGEAYYEHFKKEANQEPIGINLKPNNTNEYNSKSVWKLIEVEYNVSKQIFGKKINFVEDKFKREIIFRDVGQAFYLAKNGFYKPSIILSGGVAEELLRLYLKAHNIKPERNTFDKYLKSCTDNKLLKSAIHKLSDSLREFRNIVHLEKEESKKQSLSKSSALGAVAAIFTLINDFESNNNIDRQ